MTTPTATGFFAHDLGQAVMNVRFAAEYGELNEKFWSRLDTLSNLLQVTAGALAFAGVFGLNTSALAVAGTVMALVSALQLTFSPRLRSIAFRDSRRALQTLDARAWDMQVDEVDRELAREIAAAPRGFEAFTGPAENRVLARHGYADQVRQLRATEKLVAALA